jgi:hypothetical protein
MTEMSIHSDIQWLRDLNGSIWNRLYNGRVEINRSLMPDEWQRIAGLIEELKLPCTMISTDFGFNVAIQILDPRDASVLLTVSPNHFPISKPGFDEAFSIFSRFTHNPLNLELLDLYGVQRPGNKGYYDY